MDLEEVKQYLKVDYEEEDDLISSLVGAAHKYLVNAGISKDSIDNNQELYKLAMKLLIAHWYEKREITGKAEQLAFSLSAILMQLRYF